MLYAARIDLEARFSTDEVTVLEQTVGAGGVERALQDAAEEADSYVAVRYTVPLPSVPAPLKVAVCDIARFRLYKDRPTEEVKYRYEQAIKWLKALARGEATLTFNPPLSSTEESAIVAPVTPVAGVIQSGVFSDAVLQGMPGAGFGYEGSIFPNTVG